MRLFVWAGAWGCADANQDAHDVTVRVVTGLVPGVEFERVETSLLVPDTGTANVLASAEATAQAGQPYARGVRVASFRAVPLEEVMVRVTAFTPRGQLLITQVLRAKLTANAALTVFLDRRCVAVECPAPGGSSALIACLAGQCVDPSCDPTNPSTHHLCGDLTFCAATTDCDDAVAACASPLCTDGICVTESLTSGEEACSEAEWCDPIEGCTPLDPSVTDAGVDAAVTGDADIEGDATVGIDADVAIDGAVAMDAGVDMAVEVDLGPDAFVPPTCGTGYEPSGDSCVDINECDMLGGAACGGVGTCVNSAGTYECECPPGYAGTGTTTCMDINECDVDNGGCDALVDCNNTPGSFTCGSCPSGYTGGGEEGCVDINECMTGADGCLGGACSNLDGSYECTSCLDGYALSDDARSCGDIDECDLATDGCGAGDCVNAPGSYTCTCPTGYDGTDTTSCTDIDECDLDTDECGVGSCENKEGTYECTCPSGYTGTGTAECMDINECDVDNGGCGVRPCYNTPGSFACGCDPTGVPFGGGDGTVGDPHRVCTATQLDAIRSHGTLHFRLFEDISLSGVTFEPITTFSGVLDGDGHAIDGLAFDRPTESELSFVKALSGTIKNVSFTNVSINGKNSLAAVFFQTSGSALVSNVHVTGAIHSNSGETVGGLGVGTAGTSIVEDSSFNGTITRTTGGGYSYLGGLIGWVTGSSSVRRCSTSGSIVAIPSAKVGGITSSLQDSATLTSSTSHMTLDVGASGNRAAGLASVLSGTAAISDCYFDGAITSGVYTGGLVAEVYAATGVSIARSYVAGVITASGGSIGAIIGHNGGSCTVSSTFWDSEVTTMGASGVTGATSRTTAQMKMAATYAGWSSPPWTIVEGSYPRLSWED